MYPGEQVRIDDVGGAALDVFEEEPLPGEENIPDSKKTDVVAQIAARRLADVVPELDASRFLAASHNPDDGVAKVSLVGAGMKSHPGVAAKTFASHVSSTTWRTVAQNLDAKNPVRRRAA